MLEESGTRNEAPAWREALPGAAGGAVGAFVLLAPPAPLAVALGAAVLGAVLGGLITYALSKLGGVSHIAAE